LTLFAALHAAELMMKRDKQILTKLTGSEWQRLKSEADEADLPLATWARRALLSLADGEKVAVTQTALTRRASPRTAETRTCEVKVRVVPSLADRISEEVQATGLSRTLFVSRVLHSHLYRGEHFLALSKRRRGEFERLSKKLVAIGRMINQIERKFNGIVRDHSLHQLNRPAEELLGMKHDIDAAYRQVLDFIQKVTREEHQYWTASRRPNEDVRAPQ